MQKDLLRQRDLDLDTHTVINSGLKHEKENIGFYFGYAFFCTNHSVMQASNIQGKSFARHCSLFSEAIRSCRNSWQFYGLFCLFSFAPNAKTIILSKKKNLRAPIYLFSMKIAVRK